MFLEIPRNVPGPSVVFFSVLSGFNAVPRVHEMLEIFPDSQKYVESLCSFWLKNIIHKPFHNLSAVFQIGELHRQGFFR